jgi:SAM-dependent methyltransferase
VGSGGEYHGIDVSARDIAFCRRHYPDPPYRFTHLQAHNPVYAPQEQKAQVPWPLEDRSMDAVTALSVWTHLDESDARYYAREIQRVLQPTGIALITLFLLDSDYEQSVIQRTDRPGRFHGVPQSLWNFDRSLHGAEHWRTPSWAEPPETAVGITAEGLEQVLQESGLTLIAQHPGNWKEVPGLFFQDVLVLKPAGR